MKKFSIQHLNGADVLHQNNKPVKCAFLNPFPMPHPITGRVDFSVPVCSNECHFFNHIILSDEVSGEKIETVFFDCVGCSKTIEK
jgi:hypothetical protein